MSVEEEIDICEIMPHCCEVCEEECYRSDLEDYGFCSGEDCVDEKCFERCMKYCEEG